MISYSVEDAVIFLFLIFFCLLFLISYVAVSDILLLISFINLPDIFCSYFWYLLLLFFDILFLIYFIAFLTFLKQNIFCCCFWCLLLLFFIFCCRILFYFCLCFSCLILQPFIISSISVQDMACFCSQYLLFSLLISFVSFEYPQLRSSRHKIVVFLHVLSLFFKKYFLIFPLIISGYWWIFCNHFLPVRFIIIVGVSEACNFQTGNNKLKLLTN